MEALKIGDVVKLNSGGPKMTVTAINSEYGTVTCCWVIDDMAMDAKFPQVCVRLVPQS